MPSNTVLIGGVFDPLHAGHLAYINAAKALGDVLVAVSDAPHKHLPVVPIYDRCKWLYAAGAGGVLWNPKSDCAWIIREHRPTAYIKGKDWEGRLPEDEVAACAEVGASIIYTDTVTQSSSALLADYQRRVNADQLARFERFVQEQKPAEKPWEPVTPFDRDTRRAIEAPQADIITEAFKGCSVLDYGCGFGYLVELLQERGMDVDGWDPHYRPAYTSAADLVICREVLEHLTATDLAATVGRIAELALRFIYITTRFTAKSHLLEFDEHDDLDPTHCTMLNQGLLRTLLVLEGFKRRPDLETRLDWQRKERVLVYERG